MNGKKSRKTFFNFDFSNFLTPATELFGVVPEDFMQKYLGDPTDPAQQPHEHPFLKECQAANFTGSLDYASMKLNVTQVFCTPKTFCQLSMHLESFEILFNFSTLRRWKSSQQSYDKILGTTEST